MSDSIVIKNAEIWYTKLDPKRPNKNMDKEKPTWELQIRTKDKAVKKEWEEKNLNVKLVDDEKEGIYYRVNLKKKAVKADGSEASPVRVVDGKLNNIDPTTIGNGSIGNLRLFQHDYEYKGKKGIASVLMALQLVKHIVYTPKDFGDDFEEAETETVIPDPPEGEAEKDF